MHEQHYQWQSPRLRRTFEMLVFGEEGYPLILFPTSMGRHYEHKERGLINALQWFIEKQLIRVYCPDSIDAHSWYNTHITPAERAQNHIAYDSMLRHEVLERVMHETGIRRVAVAGCSFGGYHAANFAFRYPEQVSYLFSLSGIFDIRSVGDRWMHIQVEPGDVLVVPAGRNHRFLLTDACRIRCVRLFRDMTGWTPVYRNPPQLAAV